MLRFVDSFSHYNSAGMATKWTTAASSISATGGRLGGGCWIGTFGPTKTLDRPLAQMASVTGIAYKTTAFSNSPLTWGVSGTDTDHLGPGSAPYSLNAVQINHAGAGILYCSYQGYILTGYDGSGDPQYAARSTNGASFTLPGSQRLQLNQWYYIELKVSWSGGVGDEANPISVEVRINEDVVLTESPTYTDAGGSHSLLLLEFQWYEIGWTGAGGGNNSSICDFYTLDDQGADNTGYLGDVHVGVIYPRVDGTYSDWTPSSGTAHFSLVNEHAHDGDTTTVAAAVAGDKDSWFFDTVANTGAVFGVQLNLTARKQDAGARKIQPLVRSGGSDFESGVDEALNTTYSDRHYIWEREPDADVQWTPSTIDAAEFGGDLTL